MGPTRRLLTRPGGLVLGAFVLAALARLPSFVHQLFDPDEASIAIQAITRQHGGALYVDAIDRKPPLAIVLYTWSFDLFGPDLRPLHVLAAVGLAAGACVVGRDLRRRFGLAAGWWGVVLLVAGAVAFLPANAQAANYSQLAFVPACFALVWARRGSPGWSLVAGIALGLAVLTRQTWAIGVVPGVVAAWLHGTDRRSRWVGMLGFAGGCGLTVAAALLFVSPAGFWHWTFASNVGFVASHPSMSLVWRSLFGNLAQVLGFHVALVACLAAVGVTQTRRRVLPDLDLWLWLATGVVAALTGFRFFGHYWLQCLPPAVLLAAPYTARLRPSLQRLYAGAVAIPTLVAVGLAFDPGLVRTLPNPAPLSAYVDQHTTSNQSIFVWGNFPEVAWRADRPSAGAFVSSDFDTGLSGNRLPGRQTLSAVTPGARAATMAQLRRSRPALVLDTSTADIRQYAAYPLSVFPALDSFIRANYHPVATVDGVRIYARNG